jgi:hypothetical protein
LPRADVRAYLAAGSYLALGLIDILVFTGHPGDAVFELSPPGSAIHLPAVHIPAAPAALTLAPLG